MRQMSFVLGAAMFDIGFNMDEVETQDWKCYLRVAGEQLHT